MRLNYANGHPDKKGQFKEDLKINKWDRIIGYILLIIGVITAWSSTYLSMGRVKHPGVPAIYAAAGYDFVFIDMEHGNYSMETVADLIRGGEVSGDCTCHQNSSFRDSFYLKGLGCRGRRNHGSHDLYERTGRGDCRLR